LASPLSLYSSISPPPPRSTRFPYTTLFRSPTGDQEVFRKNDDLIKDQQKEQIDTQKHAVNAADNSQKKREKPLRILRHIPGEKQDRKSTRLNSSHVKISYAVFCLKKKNEQD